MTSARTRRSRRARWLLVPVAAAAAIGGQAPPAWAGTPLGNVISVADGINGPSRCARLSSGHLVCWGANAYGQLGHGNTTYSDVPVAVVGITGATAIVADTAGQDFCALLSTGHVDCWGYNGYGELGNGTTTQSDVPVPVKNIATATAVTGGSYSFCARLSTGHVNCWGKNGHGQLGNRTTTDSHVPVAVSGISTARSVSNGWNSFCALLLTGHLDCWGDNGYGQLGNGSWTPYSDVPTPVVGIGGVTSVTGGGNSESRCAVLSTGKVECWGVNIYGELGNGTTTGSNAPVPVKNITTATAVADDNFEGASFCARLGTGQVECWGYNLHGELGNGTMTDSHVPVPVKSVTSGTAVVGGDSSFCTRLSTGHLDCWGYNGYGQLGNATTTDSDVPVAPRGVSSAATLIYGYDSFCAVLSTKAVDCWGQNTTGQLGNDSTTDSDVPVPVLAAS